MTLLPSASQFAVRHEGELGVGQHRAAFKGEITQLKYLVIALGQRRHG